MMRQNVFIYFPADTYLGRISLPLPSAIADQQGEAAHARLYTLGVCSEVTFSAGEKEFSSCKRWLEIGPRPSGPASCPGGAACRLQNGWSFIRPTGALLLRLTHFPLWSWFGPWVPLPWLSAEVGWNRLLMGTGPPQGGDVCLGGWMASL